MCVMGIGVHGGLVGRSRGLRVYIVGCSLWSLIQTKLTGMASFLGTFKEDRTKGSMPAHVLINTNDFQALP